MALRRLTALLLLLFFVSGISIVGAQAEPLKVVATYSVLGDIVQNVAGDTIELTVLVGLDGDPHVYEPTPEDLIALAEADILFENGLELEPWIDDLYEASGSTATRIAVSDGIDVLEFAGHDHDHAHEDEGHGGFMEDAPMVGGRLIVNDYESGSVHIIDLRSNEVIADFDLTARASLYPSPSGRYAFAIQTGGNITNLIDSGVSAVPHDDHFHTDFGSPALLGAELEGTTPIHYTPHHDQIAIFHDGDGAATVFTEDGLFAGEMITVTTARPHHGVAVPMGDVVLISAPNMEDMDSALPIGVDVMTLEGEIVQSFHECPGLHGEAAYSEAGVAFGCADGILLVERDGDTFVSRKIANPTENPDLRTGTLYAVEGAAYLLGNYGQNTVVRVDPVAGTSEIVIEAPARVWRFSFHGEDPTKLVALTIDGNLHVIDIASGAIEGTVQVVDPFLPPAQGRAAARPTFVVNGHMAYVSEPLPGDIRGVNLETLEISEDRIFVGGKPSSMAVFGMTTEEELYGEHDHDHEGEAHDHEHGEFDPHTWMSPLNVMVMTENIRDALAAADAANAATYEANATAYLAELETLDAYIREQVATIPEANRILVTTHELFGYFARDYGFIVLDSALGSVTTAAEPAAGQVALVIEEIRDSGVPAVFVENVGNPALMQQIATEAGVTLAPPLYTHGLGPAGSGAETYVGMMRYNIDIIAEALQ
jgi:ABC-type Zn uptake system ZnuABC Zn-binding protein ZnuA